MRSWLRRHIFLIDGLGALASLVGTAVLVPLLEPWLGLPSAASWLLAAPAAVFAIFSMSCWARRARLYPWLLGIAMANLAYCVFAVAVLVSSVDTVTALGWTYFAVEAVVVLILVAVELAVVRQP